MENNKLLPLGSIVFLKDGVIKMLIIGRRNLIAKEGEKKPILFDYAASPYPIGFAGNEQLYHFNHENIDKVIFSGFTDVDDERAIEMMEEWKVANANEFVISKIEVSLSD